MLYSRLYLNIMHMNTITTNSMIRTEVTTSNPKRVLVQCPNQNCRYEWTYTGRFVIYATCPSCRRNIKIEENRINSPRSAQVGTPRQTTGVENTLATKGVDVRQ